MRVLFAMLLISCAPTMVRHVFVAKTDEGGKCWRECTAIAKTCEAARENIGGLAGMGAARTRREQCRLEQQDCLMTCPGAREEWVAE
jgi:hypothetical protein